MIKNKELEGRTVKSNQEEKKKYGAKKRQAAEITETTNEYQRQTKRR